MISIVNLFESIYIRINNTRAEQEMKILIERVISKYDFPWFAPKKIKIIPNTTPRSHPVIIINTRILGEPRDKQDILVLEVLIHENFHWWKHKTDDKMKAIKKLQELYPEKGRDFTSKHPTEYSYWEHIIVNWNTLNVLTKILSKKDVDYIYSRFRPYPTLDKYIRSNFNKVKNELDQVGMIYDFSN